MTTSDEKSLADIKKGEEATIIAVRGGISFQERVYSMGIYIGGKIKVIDGRKGGRMLIATGDTRLGLGHGMAEKILVANEKYEETSLTFNNR